MNAIKLLEKDHRDVKALFRKYERAGQGAHKEKQTLAQQIIRALSIHAAIEEQFFYPAARAVDERLSDQVLEALEEHHVAKWTLNELDRMKPDDERFDAKMTVLMENIRHHIDEEERELFPKLQKRLAPTDLDELGRLLEGAKKASPTHSHPMAPDTPPGNVIAGPLAKLLDLGRDFARSFVNKARQRTATAAKAAKKRVAAAKKAAKAKAKPAKRRRSA
ncbi:MAG TPA: hemerythrin domain-containing protein [Polyangia bacterium]|nr:hemerythrin domain-containing protein [Polyangia bacterium]